MCLSLTLRSGKLLSRYYNITYWPIWYIGESTHYAFVQFVLIPLMLVFDVYFVTFLPLIHLFIFIL